MQKVAPSPQEHAVFDSQTQKKAIVSSSTRVDDRGIPRWCRDGDRNHLHRVSACETDTFRIGNIT